MPDTTATMQEEWVGRYYSQGQLQDKRRNYLRSCNYQEFRRLVRSGEIDAHLETKANECRRYAVALIEQGTFYEQAWSWAVRVHLLDSDMC